MAACQRLLASVKFKKDPIQRSVVQGKKSKGEYIIRGLTLMAALRELPGKVMITQSLPSTFAGS